MARGKLLARYTITQGAVAIYPEGKAIHWGQMVVDLLPQATFDGTI